MNTKNTSLLLSLVFALSALADNPSKEHHAALGPGYEAAPALAESARPAPRRNLDAVRRWNQIAIDASGLDHTPVAVGENRVFGEALKEWELVVKLDPDGDLGKTAAENVRIIQQYTTK